MLHLSDTIFRAMDTNQISVLMTVDESSAFDCVTHKLLLRKLSLYNFDDSTCTWINSYIQFCTQYITIEAHRSGMSPVYKGVPQGLVLRPILYMLYINELAETIKDDNCTNQSHLDKDIIFTRNCINCGALPSYTDDVAYIISNNSRDQKQHKLTENLQKIKCFLNDNTLCMNKAKATLLELMVRQKRVRMRGVPLSILTKDENNKDKLITAGEHVCLLGGNFHMNLSWQAMILTGEKALLPVLRKKLGALKHIGNIIPKKGRQILATGLVLSRINYLIQMWGGTEAKYIRNIQIVLNETARYVIGANRRTSTRWLMEQCGWLYVSELIIIHSLTTIWKVVWVSAELSTSPGRLKITAKSYTWRSIDTWNTLPDNIRKINSPQIKKLCQKMAALLKIHTRIR